MTDDATKLRGPSPRVRGNPKPQLCTGRRAGTIPAGAGEPHRDDGAPPRQGDHPRGCGGTYSDIVQHPSFLGTIPAGAGEPNACD